MKWQTRDSVCVLTKDVIIEICRVFYLLKFAQKVNLREINTYFEDFYFYDFLKQKYLQADTFKHYL